MYISLKGYIYFRLLALVEPTDQTDQITDQTDNMTSEANFNNHKELTKNNSHGRITLMDGELTTYSFIKLLKNSIYPSSPIFTFALNSSFFTIEDDELILHYRGQKGSIVVQELNLVLDNIMEGQTYH